MKLNNKNEKINERIKNVEMKSWTWERLTAEEKNLFILLFNNIDSAATTDHGVFKIVHKVYTEALKAVGYHPLEWRN